MEFWEFLLQKEGDRSWLPLESPKVEILEGRYRVVARSNRVNTPVEIRITHDSTTELPPVRRTQKRSGKTNRDGLVVIIPFTRLSPGMWELRCTSELMADMLGEGWQYAVQFQIEPETADEDWEPDWQGNVTGAEAVEPEQITPADQGEITLAPTHAEPATSIQPEPITTAESIAPELNPLTSLASESLTAEPLTAEPDSAATLNPELGSYLVANNPTIAETENLEAENLEPDSEPTNLESANLEPENLEPENLEPSTSNSAAPEFLEPVTDTPASVSPQEQSPAQAASLFPLTDASATPAFASKTWDRVPPIRLRLAQETYVVERGQPLSVIGQVEHFAGLLTDEIPVGELHIRLYDPRTSRVLVDRRQPLTPRRLPFPFSCQLTLPDHYQTYLLLGEVVLYGIPTAESSPELATQSFTVTTDLHELLESIANDFAEPELPPPVAPDPHPVDNVDNIAFLNLATTAQVTLEFRVSASPILPPKLHPNNPDRSPKAPELPSFGRTPAQPEAQPEAQPDNVAARDTTPDPETDLMELSPIMEADFSAETIPDVPITEAIREERAVIDPALMPQAPANAITSSETGATPIIQSFDDADPIPDWYVEEDYLPQWQRQSPPVANPSADAKDAAFRALNLQERFWERLQALISDRELLNRLQAEADESTSEAGHSPEDGSVTPVETGRSKQTPLGLDAVLAAQEVVAEDALSPVRLTNDATSEASGTDAFQPTFALVVPIEQPIPPPQIELRARELVAGQSFNLTVKLPNIPARLYAKLWLRDRQTRTLLSGPHWLTEFVPDGFGNQIIRTELTVPKGCLEVQLEAITIEMPTQRESDKVSVTREVIPPNLSAFSLDDFEI